MSDHLVLFIDRLVSSPKSVQEEDNRSSIVEKEVGPSCSVENADDLGEEEPLIQVGECRICQEDDSITNLETPCACNGSVKYLGSGIRFEFCLAGEKEKLM
ncbi:hypothetical protein QYF36_023920 [Acer negundo]|nr:hypothetical protein QYF36_023920 [Acer negundo]